MDEANIDDNSCLYKTIEVKYKKIKYKTKKKYSLLRSSGTVIKKGVKGKRKYTYEVIKDNTGKVISKELINKVVVKKPVNKVVSTKNK